MNHSLLFVVCKVQHQYHEEQDLLKIKTSMRSYIHVCDLCVQVCSVILTYYSVWHLSTGILLSKCKRVNFHS